MAYPARQTQVSGALPAAPTQLELVEPNRAGEEWQEVMPD